MRLPSPLCPSLSPSVSRSPSFSFSISLSVCVHLLLCFSLSKSPSYLPPFLLLSLSLLTFLPFYLSFVCGCSLSLLKSRFPSSFSMYMSVRMFALSSFYSLCLFQVSFPSLLKRINTRRRLLTPIVTKHRRSKSIL